VRCKAGALELTVLLGRVALGHEDKAMPGREIYERLADVREKFNLVVCDGIGKTQDMAMLLVRHRSVGKLLIAVKERASKAAEAIPVSRDRGMLTAVQMLTDFNRRMDLVVEKGDEGGNSTLEINVVFPEGVVGIDEQSLAGRSANLLGIREHDSIIEGVLATE
jgi:hypothetical protein